MVGGLREFPVVFGVAWGWYNIVFPHLCWFLRMWAGGVRFLDLMVRGVLVLFLGGFLCVCVFGWSWCDTVFSDLGGFVCWCVGCGFGCFWCMWWFWVLLV